ncbi:Hypothetical protein HVR_LOCUS22 [uncultured virus]|nr:Hypothetical protein HVR_LOCUS22 [uncultured virus]
MEEFIEEELTIIDGDVLEDTFENWAGTHDRFTHVIVCDLTEIPFRAVPYIYARNIVRVRDNMTTVPAQTYPDYEQYAIRGELLRIITHNPDLLCSLVDKQDAIIPNLHQELRELEQLEMFDEESARSLSSRLKAFLKTVRVGNYSGEGIFWLPQNYQGDEDNIDQLPDESYEDYTRRAICTHIKCRRLPMAHVIPTSEERMTQLKELVESLNMYYRSSFGNHYLEESHFAPLVHKTGRISHAAFKVLMAEEFRCVKNDEDVDGNSMFVFTDEELDRFEDTIKTTRARELLRNYVGDYLDDLDLSRTFITGSSLTASLIRTNDSQLLNRNNTLHTNTDHGEPSYPRVSTTLNTDCKEVAMELFYPRVLTTFDKETLERLRAENVALWNIRALSETEGVMTKGDTTIGFRISSGSDVDMAIDNTVSDEEYRKIAEDHFEVIRRFYPYVKMREYTKPKGDWNYVIYTDDPHYIPVFRTVEMYRSSFRNICSHHVGAVRGCYTSRWTSTTKSEQSSDQRPKFYLTASGLFTSRYGSTPNYHYFAGRKSNPQDIIIKNMIRGINISDDILSGIIYQYIRHNNIEISHLPFYKGRGIPFSIFSAAHEYPYIQDELRRMREEEERRLRRMREKEEHRLQRMREEEERRLQRMREEEERRLQRKSQLQQENDRKRAAHERRIQHHNRERQAFLEANQSPILQQFSGERLSPAIPRNRNQQIPITLPTVTISGLPTVVDIASKSPINKQD